MGIRTLSVTELTNYLKRILVNDPILNNLTINGEISNFKLHNSGHVYFSIKDTNSKLKCVMFSREFKGVDFLPEDGMKVVLKGYISIYDRNGEYQLYVTEMKREGLGDLYVAFEKLKIKLQEKGYFDSEHKQSIPPMPKKVAVVTSATGAAIRDVISVIKRRNKLTDILVYPVLVQGERSAQQISRAIDTLNTIPSVDLIILTRGGGSIEELWAFNEEILAESIFNSKKPIISAVGHETDFTIADFVADLRAPTPSAAGEIAVPQLDEVKASTELMYRSLKTNLVSIINNYKSIIEGYNSERMAKYFIYKRNEEKQTIDYFYNQLYNIINNTIASHKKEILFLGDNLNSLSPLATISRGYGIVTDLNKNSVTRVTQLSTDDKVNVLLVDGRLTCIVNEIEKGVHILEAK